MDSKLLPLSFLGTVPSNPQLSPNYPKPPVKRNGFGTVYRTTQPLFPIGTIRKIVKPSWEGYFKNGTRSVLTTLDLRCRLTHPGSEGFPRIMGLPPHARLFPIILPGCIICPSLARRARKDIIPKRRNFTRQVRSAKIRQTTIS